MDLRVPPILDVHNIIQSWKKFKIHFEIYSTAKELNLKSEKVRAATLLNLVGEEALELILTLISNKSDLENPDTIISLLNDYVKSKNNLVYKRYLFNNRNQQKNETFEDFYEAISELAESCEFSHDKESLIRDRIISGVQNNILRARLLNEEFSLAEVVKICTDFGTKKPEAKQKNFEEILKRKIDADIEESSNDVGVKRLKENHGDARNSTSEVEFSSKDTHGTDIETAEKLSVLEAEMGYNPLTFWKSLPTMTVIKSEPDEVKRMTKILFKSLLTKQPPSKILHLACHVSVQLRSPEDVNELIINPEDIESNTKVGNCVIGVLDENQADYEITCPNAAKLYGKCFTSATEEYAHIWGPCFAFALLGITRRDIGFCVNKIRLSLVSLYKSVNFKTDSCPDFKDIFPVKSPFLRETNKTEVRPLQYNTILYGLISAYCKNEESLQFQRGQTKKLFDFLYLPTLKYNGMNLFVLVDKLKKYFECTSKDLAAEYCYPECVASWERVFLFEEKCLNALLEDKFWGYARNFRKETFSKLSYIDNYFLCNLLGLHASITARFAKWYFDLRSLFSSSKHMIPISKSDVDNAVAAHNKLKTGINSKMGSKKAEERLLEAVKLANQAAYHTNENLCFKNCGIPPPSLKDLNYVILTHVELEEKYQSRGFTPLEIVFTSEGKSGPFKDRELNDMKRKVRTFEEAHKTALHLQFIKDESSLKNV